MKLLRLALESELPEELPVDELSDESNTSNEKNAEQLEQAGEVVEALEQYKEILNNSIANNTFNDSCAQLFTLSLSQLANKGKINISNSLVALESADSIKSQQTIALETFQETIAKIFAKIKEFMKKIVDWVKGFFNKAESKADDIKNKASKMEDSIKNLGYAVVKPHVSSKPVNKVNTPDVIITAAKKPPLKDFECANQDWFGVVNFGTSLSELDKMLHSFENTSNLILNSPCLFSDEYYDNLFKKYFDDEFQNLEDTFILKKVVISGMTEYAAGEMPLPRFFIQIQSEELFGHHYFQGCVPSQDLTMGNGARKGISLTASEFKIVKRLPYISKNSKLPVLDNDAKNKVLKCIKKVSEEVANTTKSLKTIEHRQIIVNKLMGIKIHIHDRKLPNATGASDEHYPTLDLNKNMNKDLDALAMITNNGYIRAMATPITQYTKYALAVCDDLMSYIEASEHAEKEYDA